jgi:hypothetical protein
MIDILPRRRFGHSELEVTAICFGTTTREDLPSHTGYPVPEDRHNSTFRAMFDSPINFMDTAAAYGDGESERRIGLLLRDLEACPTASCWPPRRTAISRPGTSAAIRPAVRSSAACALLAACIGEAGLAGFGDALW